MKTITSLLALLTLAALSIPMAVAEPKPTPIRKPCAACGRYSCNCGIIGSGNDTAAKSKPSPTPTATPTPKPKASSPK